MAEPVAPPPAIEPGSPDFAPILHTDAALLAYLVGTLGLVLWTAARETLPAAPEVIGAHVTCLAGVLLILYGAARFRGPVWQMVHGWYPVAVILIVFRELHYLVPAVNPNIQQADAALMRADFSLFGVDPTLAIEPWIWPPAVEVLQIIYALFYFIPMILGVVLWRRRAWAQFCESQCAIVLGFLSSYIGFFLMPALGPRFTQCDPPAGVWLATWIQNSLNALELRMCDCFPSGHAEVSLLTLWCAWRFHRPTAWALLPVGLALIVSTVYLRYHYVVDVLAAVVWAIGVGWTVKRWHAPQIISPAGGAVPRS